MILPHGWTIEKFESVVKINDNLRKPINNAERELRISGKKIDELFPYYGATGQVGYIDGYITDGEYVLLGEDGAPFLNSYANKAYIIRGKTWVNNHAHVLKSKYNNKFLCHYLNYIDYNGYITGTTRLKLTQGDMKRIPILNPPASEQQRIVAKIDSLFSKLDNGTAFLKNIKIQLAIYKQAVLKWAFEGKLTEEWRKRNHISDWEYVTIEKFLIKTDKPMSTGPFGTMLKKHEHKIAGVPVLGIENIGKGVFITGNKIFVTQNKAEYLKSFVLHTNDVIISRSGTVGELCLVPPQFDGSLMSTNLIRVTLDEKVIIPNFFVFLFQSKGIVIDQIKELCKGSTRPFLNQTILKKISFPLLNINEQQQIIDKIESRLSLCDKLEQTINDTLALSTSLRQSILKKAFEGRLVPQDPSDEPAEKLLERIKAEKTAVPAKQKQTRKRGRK